MEAGDRAVGLTVTVVYGGLGVPIKNEARLANPHTTVLAIANAGALHHALAEYDRLGLERAVGDEEAMALRGRLLKDIYKTHSGQSACEWAQKAADAYAAAFEATRGYYSGINAATLSLLAGEESEIVLDHVTKLLNALPDPETRPPQDRYFIEATRAEAYLLRGEAKKAEQTLEGARVHDPLNYTAHASTLKQFAMIADFLSIDLPWLAPLRPPKSAHYCGPLFSERDRPNLPEAITEAIQRCDIGFAFGALAAGSDILFAEAILEEGADLHVVLPAPEDIFIAASVEPQGAGWTRRFLACLEAATTIRIVAGRPIGHDRSGYDSFGDDGAALAAMGDAIRHAWSLGSSAIQLQCASLPSLGRVSSRNAGIWAAAERPIQWIFDNGNAAFDDLPAAPNFSFRLVSDTGQSAVADSVNALPDTLENFRRDCGSMARIATGLADGLTGPPITQQDLEDMAREGPPGSDYADPPSADCVSLFLADRLLASRIDAGDEHEPRFALRRIGRTYTAP